MVEQGHKSILQKSVCSSVLLETGAACCVTSDGSDSNFNVMVSK